MEGDSSAASSAELTGETTVAENHKTSESATTAASHGAAADKTTAAETTGAAATTASRACFHPTADSGKQLRQCTDYMNRKRAYHRTKSGCLKSKSLRKCNILLFAKCLLLFDSKQHK